MREPRVASHPWWAYRARDMRQWRGAPKSVLAVAAAANLHVPGSAPIGPTPRRSYACLGRAPGPERSGSALPVRRAGTVFPLEVLSDQVFGQPCCRPENGSGDEGHMGDLL